MDNEILDLLRAHDEAGLRLLEKSYGKMILYIVRSINSNNCDIEECVSDIYRKIWDNIESFDAQKGEFRSWLTAIARNTAVTKLKKKQVNYYEFDESTPDGETTESLAMKNEQKKILARAIEKLSLSDRNLLFRKYYYMQSVEQIAAETGISLRAAEGRLYRIRKKLRKELGGYFDE
ncbi:MAG: sigma-70 family RNA polymerase sigma factor [Ruminococcus sp.]|nr:sigma-70 family RNA polymerase sigma factor [Ruminococcus sp.]